MLGEVLPPVQACLHDVDDGLAQLRQCPSKSRWGQDENPGAGV